MDRQFSVFYTLQFTASYEIYFVNIWTLNMIECKVEAFDAHSTVLISVHIHSVKLLIYNLRTVNEKHRV